MKLKLADGTELVVKKYPLPKRGNGPADFALVMDGTKTPAFKTGGGKFPVYTYFAVEGAGYYVKHDLATGAEVSLVKDAAKAAPAPEAAPTPAPTPTPEPERKLTKAERKAAAKAAKAGK